MAAGGIRQGSGGLLLLIVPCLLFVALHDRQGKTAEVLGEALGYLELDSVVPLSRLDVGLLAKAKSPRHAVGIGLAGHGRPGPPEAAEVAEWCAFHRSP